MSLLGSKGLEFDFFSIDQTIIGFPLFVLQTTLFDRFFYWCRLSCSRRTSSVYIYSQGNLLTKVLRNESSLFTWEFLWVPEHSSTTKYILPQRGDNERGPPDLREWTGTVYYTTIYRYLIWHEKLTLEKRNLLDLSILPILYYEVFEWIDIFKKEEVFL